MCFTRFAWKRSESEKSKPAKVKQADPAQAARARELRDRYLEQFNAQWSAAAPALPGGKYDLARTPAPLPESAEMLAPLPAKPPPLLAA